MVITAPAEVFSRASMRVDCRLIVFKQLLILHSSVTITLLKHDEYEYYSESICGGLIVINVAVGHRWHSVFFNKLFLINIPR